MTVYHTHRFSGASHQRGAVLMLLLLLVSVGALAVFVSGLNRASVQLERDRITAAALAKAKEALIGYAVKDAVRPGELPCPDVNDDGKLVMNVDYVGSNCVQLMGRFPWITLGVPDLRDGNGERLWYAVSNNFQSNGAGAINSDTQGTLTITGTLPVTQVVAVLFAAGPALAGQYRDSANKNLVANYLEATNATSTTSFVAGNATDIFNDRLLPILHSDLLPKVETRIARDAKKCLDEYATTSGGKYPWAAKLDGTAVPEYSGDFNFSFGRFPQTPNISISATSPPTPQQCIDAQNALNNPPCSHSMAPQKCQDALAIVQACASPPSVNDPQMGAVWPSDCTNNFVNRYWGDWKELIFYQVAPGYQPGSSASCPTCLTLNETGGYRAMIMVTGKKLSAQKRVGDAGFSDDVTNYLEDGNSDGNYNFDLKWPTGTFNDKTVCLDGQITCK